MFSGDNAMNSVFYIVILLFRYLFKIFKLLTFQERVTSLLELLAVAARLGLFPQK